MLPIDSRIVVTPSAVSSRGPGASATSVPSLPSEINCLCDAVSSCLSSNAASLVFLVLVLVDVRFGLFDELVIPEAHSARKSVRRWCPCELQRVQAPTARYRSSRDIPLRAQGGDSPLVCQAASSGARQRVPITLWLAVHRGDGRLLPEVHPRAGVQASLK